MLVILLACSDASLLPGDKAADTGVTDNSVDTASGTDTTGTEDAPHPAWYTLSATATLLAGAPTAVGAEVVIVDEDQVSEICRAPIDTTGFFASEPPVEEIVVWWEIPELVVESDCPFSVTTLAFGIGELIPEVRARLGQVGLDADADRLYGAFARVENGDNYAIGYAEAENSGGEATFPLPDDDYSLTPLFLLPLP